MSVDDVDEELSESSILSSSNSLSSGASSFSGEDTTLLQSPPPVTSVVVEVPQQPDTSPQRDLSPPAAKDESNTDQFVLSIVADRADQARRDIQQQQGGGGGGGGYPNTRSNTAPAVGPGAELIRLTAEKEASLCHEKHSEKHDLEIVRKIQDDENDFMDEQEQGLSSHIRNLEEAALEADKGFNYTIDVGLGRSRDGTSVNTDGAGGTVGGMAVKGAAATSASSAFEEATTGSTFSGLSNNKGETNPSFLAYTIEAGAADTKRQERGAGPPLAANLRNGTGMGNQAVVRPGAYSQGGQASDCNGTLRTGSSITISNSSHQSTIEPRISPPLSDDDGLVVASPVGEVGPELPLAEPRDHDLKHTSSTVDQAKQRYTKYLFLVVTCLLALVLVILLAVFLTGDASSSNEEGGSTLTPSASPTIDPRTPEEYVLSLLPDFTIKAISQDPNSPQAKAMDWIVNDPSILNYTDDYRILQRFVLSSIYFSTSGDNWLENSNWLSYNTSITECQWFIKSEFGLQGLFQVLYPGWLTEFVPSNPNSSCSTNGHIQNLWLDQNGLAGSIPAELYLLTSLQTFSFGFDQLQGTGNGIPSLIGHLTNLEAFQMIGVQNGGTIPSEVGLLSNSLRVLGLATSQHTGILPSEAGLLTNLEYFSTGNNPDLRGNLPSLIGFSNLKWVSLSICAYTGTLPSEHALLHPSLNYYMMNENNLTGSMPTDLGLLTDVTYFNVRGNQLDGVIPSEIGLLTQATTLKMGHNQLSGEIPTELFNLNQVRKLDLSNNRLGFKIPTEFGLLTSLLEINLANNSFMGLLPQEMSVLKTSLASFDLRGNPHLSGIIPASLCGVNATCIGNALDGCADLPGLTFDCHTSLCGCDCPCPGEKANATTGFGSP